jgi:hypothetical protein
MVVEGEPEVRLLCSQGTKTDRIEGAMSIGREQIDQSQQYAI